MRRIYAFATIALLMTSLVPMVDAHAAPAARDFETRVMHDHNDDSAFLTVQGKHGFDAIALDVREGFDVATGPVVIFRLLLNGGCNTSPVAGDCPDLKHSVLFKADGTDQQVDFVTSDAGATWTGSAPRYEGPFGLNDGNRFAVEAWVPMSQIGVAPGTSLTDWFVEGYAGDSPADNMPEGAAPGYDDPLGAAFVVDAYTVQAPDYYLSIEAGPSTVDGTAGTEVRWGFNLTNLITDTQNVTFTLIGLPATVEREGALVSEDMAPGVTRSYEVVLTPEQSGTVTLIASSDLGGAVAVAFQVDLPVKPAGLNVMSPDILPGGNFSHTFGVVGTMEYHDHNNMAAGGKVIVGPAAANATTHTITYDGSTFSPDTLTIAKGDTVIWQNDGEANMAIMGSGSGHDHGDHDHDHEHVDDKGVPGVGFVLVALGLLAVALVARRR